LGLFPQIDWRALQAALGAIVAYLVLRLIGVER
jgi:hypothetical protein